jgi:hypothetical protein
VQLVHIYIKTYSSVHQIIHLRYSKTKHRYTPKEFVNNKNYYVERKAFCYSEVMMDTTIENILINFFNLHSGGWNQGPLDTAAT